MVKSRAAKQHLPDDGRVERSVLESSGLNGVEFLNLSAAWVVWKMTMKSSLSDAQRRSKETRLESRTSLRCGMKAILAFTHTHKHTHNNHTRACAHTHT